jgi:hypothetical protein
VVAALSESVVLSLLGAVVTVVGGLVTWWVTARRTSDAQAEGLVAGAAKTLTESSVALVTQYRALLDEADNECERRIEQVEGRCQRRLDALAAEVVRLGGDPALLLTE